MSVTRSLRGVVLAAMIAFTAAVGGSLPPPAVPAAVAASPFELNLYSEEGDFVSQTNLVQCVGASMQMMINLLEEKNDRSTETQKRLWSLAREWNRRRSTNTPPRGASVRGWAGGLNRLGYGPYAVQPFATMEEAIRAAARAMRATGKPVGLLMLAGRHAWVMSGYRATADPLKTDSFKVTHVTVLDPLYPRPTSGWGRNPAPGEAVSLGVLDNVFVPRRKTTFSGTMSGKFVIVMPLSTSRGELRLRIS